MILTRLTLTALAGGALALGTAAAADAVGTPQRERTLPPGLTKAFQRQVPGLLIALARTQGANSRLQDLPASP